MNRNASIYLDLLRSFAALSVVLFHASFLKFGGKWLWWISGEGTDSVMIFFVLSGYVITYVAMTKENTFEIFLTNRLARLYSVVFAAILLASAVDLLTGTFWKLTYLASLFFVNEVWNFALSPASNPPFWSLCYEVFYYAIFAAFLYSQGYVRILIISALMIFAGPNILLLFPVWITGGIVYMLSRKVRPNKWLGVSFLALSLLGYFLLFSSFHGMYRSLFQFNSPNWGNLASRSRGPLYSYILGFLVGMQIIGFHACSQLFDTLLAAIEKPVKFIAGGSFSLYLYHYPLLVLLAHFLKPAADDTFSSVLIIGLTLIGCFGLSFVTERKKNEVRKLVRFCWSYFSAPKVIKEMD